MKRIRLVAAREFVTTVSNKGFIIGLLIMPALAFLLIRVAPKIVNSRSPEVHGDIAVIDPTGQVMPELRKVLDPGYIQRLRVPNAAPFGGPGAPPPVLRHTEVQDCRERFDARGPILIERSLHAPPRA